MNLRWLSLPLALLGGGLSALPACRVLAPTKSGPETACHASCRQKVAAVCSDDGCWRGCNLVLDRVIERETEVVLRCMAHSRRGCDDTAWSECAARVGPRADGGPPAPADEIFDDED